MKVLLLVPDGVGIRNFILGPFLDQLLSAHEVDTLHVVPDDLLPRYAERLNGRVGWHPLKPGPEKPLPLMLRSALGYAHLYWSDTPAMRFNANRAIGGSWRSRAVHHTARLVGHLAANQMAIRLLDRCHAMAASRLPEVDHYRRLFERIRPQVLFCSHQRPPAIIAPVLAARALGIPTATFIFSWDNLSSKGRIAAPFDHYLVWSELMRDELLRYYPDVAPHRVRVVGTPQFDPYTDAGLLWSRDEFFDRIGADERRPLICYSGGDTGNCPEDHEHVRALLELIRSGRIGRAPQVLVRPSPADEGRRYDSVRREFPELIFVPPMWIHAQSGRWDHALPLAEDVQFLANLTQHTDININLGSTMTLDFAIRDKPVVNVAFDIAHPPPFGTPIWEHHYRFDHYRPVIEFGAARFARSREELVQHVNAYLENPALDRDGRRRLVELEVGWPVGRSGPRVLNVLNDLARN